MAYIGDLVVRLSAETGEFRSDLQRASQTAESSFSGISAGAIKAGAAMAGLAVAAVALNFAKGVGHVLEVADNLSKLSEKTGIATEDLSSLRVSAELSDVPLESLSTGLKKLAVNMSGVVGGSKEQMQLFKDIGVSAADSNGKLRKTDDVLGDIAAKFASWEDGPGKAAIAVALFGKSGESLIPMLNNLSRTQDEGRRLGLIYGSEFSKQAEEFNDNVKRMSLMTERLKIAVAENIVGRLKDVSEELVDNTAKGQMFYGVLIAIGQALGWIDTLKGGAAKEKFFTGQKIFDLQDQRDQLMREGGQFSGNKMDKNSPEIKAIDAKIAALRERNAELTTLLEPPVPKEPPKFTPPKLNKTDLAAETKQYQSALQALEKQIESTNMQGSYAITVYEVTKGSLKGLTEAHKQELMAKALEVDALKNGLLFEQALYEQRTKGFVQTEAAKAQNEILRGKYRGLGEMEKDIILYEAQMADQRATAIAMTKEFITGLQAEVQLRERLRDVTFEYAAAQRASAQQAEFELSLIGKTARQKEELAALRQIDIEFRQAAERLQSIDEATPGIGEALAELAAQAEARKRMKLKEIGDRLEAERSWVTGAKAAFQEYMDDALNAASQAKSFFTSAFRTLEDLQMDFITNSGKGWKQYAQNFINEIARMELRAANAKIFGAISDNGGLLGSIGKVLGFGGGGGDYGASSVYAASLGGIGDSFSFLAEGGPLWSGQTAVVGENGPEVISAGVTGNVTPNHALGGNSFYVDMRGASLEAVQRLEAFVQQINGSIENRAVGAVLDAKARGAPV